MNDEIKKRRGRPPKPRQGILSAEQILAIRGGAPQTVETAEEAAARREAERLRGVKRRAEARIEKQVESVTSLQDLWKLNRSTLSEQRLADFHEREERVLDLISWMDLVVSGNNVPPDDPCYVSLDEGRQDVEAHVAANGFTMIEISLLGEFWKSADLYARFLLRTDSTSTFARYGFVVGIPAHRYQEWQELLAAGTATPTATPFSNGYTTLKCSIPDCPSWPDAVSESIASEYREKNIPYRCGRCIRLEHQARNESTLVQRGAHTIYGRGGIREE